MKRSSAGLQKKKRKKKKTVKSRSTRQESPLYYVSIEEAFDVISSANISTDRGGIDLMLEELLKKIMYTFQLRPLSCSSLSVKNAKRSGNADADDEGCCQSPNTHQFLSRGQVDLTYVQRMTSGFNKKWILVYQDHLTKFKPFQL
ncbi:KRAB-A domain-containing protein 2 [Plakobranchus ocellatus]|uniref:KRAB-A domain-containing protein 2 n=1 Tax=Plakobranchus ocellatus TaxID=259542 RepID=A0AAV4BMR9_9GAST|nr:KRAB-A domain-containing protein 2 [Plakobranchus ocellatus]